MSGGRLPSPEQRRATGKALREKVPLERHAEWKESAGRRDPITILIESNKGRVPELVPIRHARMLTSPFAFLRGSAAVMASDLSTTPTSGPRVQACGDCHLMNFGGFATPERQLIFSINDFDETLPAPWEWDVKRLAASIVVAGRYINLKERQSQSAAEAAARWYRRWMSRYADMRVFDVWYDHVNVEEILGSLSRAARKRLTPRIEKARSRSVIEHDFPKLVDRTGGRLRIKDTPPLIFHEQSNKGKAFRQNVLSALKTYREALVDPYRAVLDRFQLQDLALKVVGVGSVGTACYVALFMASDRDPLFLQIKQANPSVLEPYAGKSIYPNQGQRVVTGQRLMQSASDIMLGWTVGALKGRHFYVRQLRDMKLSALVEAMEPGTLNTYSKLCGWTLARAHARSGDPATIAGYLGKRDVFDQAIAQFAAAYADQTESDHRAMRKASRDGRLEVSSIDN